MGSENATCTRDSVNGCHFICEVVDDMGQENSFEASESLAHKLPEAFSASD